MGDAPQTYTAAGWDDVQLLDHAYVFLPDRTEVELTEQDLVALKFTDKRFVPPVFVVIPIKRKYLGRPDLVILATELADEGRRNELKRRAA